MTSSSSIKAPHAAALLLGAVTLYLPAYAQTGNRNNITGGPVPVGSQPVAHAPKPPKEHLPHSVGVWKLGSNGVVNFCMRVGAVWRTGALKMALVPKVGFYYKETPVNCPPNSMKATTAQPDNSSPVCSEIRWTGIPTIFMPLPPNSGLMQKSTIPKGNIKPTPAAPQFASEGVYCGSASAIKDILFGMHDGSSDFDYEGVPVNFSVVPSNQADLATEVRMLPLRPPVFPSSGLGTKSTQ